MGRSLDFIGDQTGDDLDHPLVTQHGYNIPAGNDAGRVLIFESDISGVVNVPTISGQTIIASDRIDDELGYDAVGVGDVNNDGWEDIVLTANGHDPPGGFDVGAAYLFLGPVWGDYDQPMPTPCSTVKPTSTASETQRRRPATSTGTVTRTSCWAPTSTTARVPSRTAARCICCTAPPSPDACAHPSGP